MSSGCPPRRNPSIASLGILAWLALALASCSALHSPAVRPAAAPASEISAPTKPPLTNPPPSTASGEFACPVFDPFDTKKHLRNTIEPLMDGDEATARTELRLALCQEPNDEAAKSLLAQLDADAEELLGKKFYVYTIQAGDSLPKIAKDFLGDPYKFYLLAKYNEIERPGRLRVGQCVKIPGAPPAAENLGERLYQCGLEELKAGDLKKADGFLREAMKSDPEHKQARVKEREIESSVVEAYHKDTVAALREQQLVQAIGCSRKILEIDPDNPEAKALLQEARSLQSRLSGLFYQEAADAFERGDWPEAIANCDKVLELDPSHEKARTLRSASLGR